jgi:hypothetical protein
MAAMAAGGGADGIKGGDVTCGIAGAAIAGAA